MKSSLPRNATNGKMCSWRISLMYRTAVRRPATTTNSVRVSEQIPAQTKTDPPWKQTVCVVVIGRNLSQCLLHTRSRPVGALKTTLHSSVHRTLLHCSWVQLACSRANRSRATRWCRSSSGPRAGLQALRFCSSILLLIVRSLTLTPLAVCSRCRISTAVRNRFFKFPKP